MSEDNAQTEMTIDELPALKAKADLMGITYHPSIGAEKLREKIQAKLNETNETPAPAAQGETARDDAAATAGAPAAAAPVAPQPETLAEKRKRIRQEALALVRIRLTCMNPAKKEWDGEIITTGNSLVGTVTKYVPFNAEEGWHVPQIMLEVLRNRQCQVFYTERTKNGIAVRKGKLIREFAIEVLPALTERELKDLAQRQAMAAGQGD